MRVLRRLIFVAVAGVYRKHYNYNKLMRFPFRLAALADTRLKMSEREDVANEFVSTNKCCARAGMARRMLALGLSPVALCGAFWRRVLYFFAFLVTCQMADVERKHRRNRQRSTTARTWGQFCSTFVNAEFQLLQHARRREVV